MIEKIIDFSARNKFLTLFVVLIVFCVGILILSPVTKLKYGSGPREFGFLAENTHHKRELLYKCCANKSGLNSYCAVIVKKVDEKSLGKVGINELLRGI